MKKLLSVLLVVAMFMALAACGSPSATAPAEEPETAAEPAPAEAPDTAPAEEPAPAAEAGSDEPSASGEASASAEAPDFIEAEPVDGDFEPRTFTIAAAVNENEVGGLYLQQFAKYVEEATGGAAQFEIYWSGSLGTSGEELGLCSEGAVDIIALEHLQYGDTLPFLNIITWICGTLDEAVDYFDYVVYENETSSAIIAQEAAEHNVVYLGGCQPSGQNVILATKEFTGLDDFRSGRLIMGHPDGIWDLLGVNHLSVLPQEVYESLQRGVCDAYEMSLGVTVLLQWYEVAKYFAFDGSQGVARPLTCNLDTWNSLSDDYKQVFLDAQKAAENYAYQVVTSSEDSYVATLEANGVTMIDMPQEDMDAYAAAQFTSAVNAARTRAANHGIEDEMETIIAIAADYLGLEVPAK